MDPTTLNTVTKGLESSIAATGQLLAKLASRPSPDEAIQLTATVVSVILPGQQGALNTLLNLNQYGAHGHGVGYHPQHHHQLTAERDNAVAQADALQRELAKTRAERNDVVAQLHQMERELELAHRDCMQHQHQHQYRVSSASSVTPPTAVATAAGPSSAHAPTRGGQQQHQQQHQVSDPYAMPPAGYPTIVPPRPPPPPPAPPAASSSSTATVPPRRILHPSHSYTSTPQPQPQPQPQQQQQQQPQSVPVSTNPSSHGSRTSSAPGSPPHLFHEHHPLPPPPGSVTDPALCSLTPTSSTNGNDSSTPSSSAAAGIKVELAHAQKRPLELVAPMDCAQAESSSTHVNGAAVDVPQNVANHKRARVHGSMTGSPELVALVSPPPQLAPQNRHHSTPKPSPMPSLPNPTPALAAAAPTSSTSYALAAEYQQQQPRSLPTSPHSIPRSPAFAAASFQQLAPAGAHDGETTSPESSLPKIRFHFKPNTSTSSSPPSPSLNLADASFYSTSGDPDASFTSQTAAPPTSDPTTAHNPPADPNQLALPTRALSHTILSSMKHFPMRYINGTLQLTDASTRVLAHELIPITAPSTDTQEGDAAKIRKYLAVTNQTLANTSLCLMQVMLARGLGVPIPHAWLLEAIMRTSGSKRSAAMRACHVAWLKPVYIVDEAEAEAQGEGVRQSLEARYCEETGALEVPAGARVVVTLGVECVGLESPRADSVPPKLEVREYVLRERWALVHR